METYCISCKSNTANTNSNVGRTKQDRLILVSTGAAYGKKISRFIS